MEGKQPEVDLLSYKEKYICMDNPKEVAFLEFVVKDLVEFPDDVKIERSTDEMGVLLTLTVNPDDMGKVIGRMGNTSKAIRTLLRTVGMSVGARVNLKITDPNPHMRKSVDAQEVHDEIVNELKG